MMTLLFALLLPACDAPTGDSKDSAAPDRDGDGWTEAEGDCDDQAKLIHPGVAETCDGVDEDCDGTVDNADTTYFVDGDGDGYGDGTTAATGCAPGTGFVADGNDCNDVDADIHPGAPERCNREDDNCDGTVDEGAEATTVYEDRDGDGYGNPEVMQDSCEAGEGWTTDSSDCNDLAAAVNPAAQEVCDGLDNDCDTTTDEAGALGESTWYRDADNDGYGSVSDPRISCTATAGYVTDATDCDDAVAEVNPGATEVCNSADDDCDGETDESGGAGTWYPDLDHDGYGDDSAPYSGCTAPSGYVIAGGDCDDHAIGVHPTATDLPYDGVDTDCSGTSDYDADGDGYDSERYGGDDCDDDRADLSPGAADTPYDGVDTDCSGTSDYDADGDGYDSATYGGDDCDDTRSDVYPGALDLDDSLDYNCDGVRNTMPVAVIAPVADSLTCLEVRLDGSASSDPEGSALTYAWELVSAPLGSALTTADLSDATAAGPSFYPDVDGEYLFSLVVTDGVGAPSVATTVSVLVGERTSNSAPVADAGADQATSYSQICTPISYGVTYECAPCRWVDFALDGSASYDADGEELRYAWSIGSGSGSFVGPDIGESVIVRFSGPTPTYGSSVTDTVSVRLTVTDCYGATSAYNAVTLTYECKGG